MTAGPERGAEPDPEAARGFGAGVDFGRTASAYRDHRAGFPEVFFEALAGQVPLRPGARALDLGAGTGTVARGLARRGLLVSALDPSVPMLAASRDLARAEGADVAHLAGRAEALPLAPGALDLVVAGQCWHWFERGRAAAEAARVLRPGGALAIAHLDWLPLPGSVVEATEALILLANPGWPMAGGTGLYPAWLADLSGAGFGGIETRSLDLDLPYPRAGWVGRVRASAGVGASLDAAAADAVCEALSATLARDFPEEPLRVPHRLWWALGRRGG